MNYVFCLLTPLYRRFRLSRVSHAQECEDIYRLVSKILNFTPFGSVFDRFCVEALKMPENLEKQLFTFFAFLPAYIGVSGSLVSRMPKISTRSIDWYQKLLISCLVARYSAVFVSYMDYYYSPARRGTTDRHPPTWSKAFLLLFGGCCSDRRLVSCILPTPPYNNITPL